MLMVVLMVLLYTTLCSMGGTDSSSGINSGISSDVYNSVCNWYSTVTTLPHTTHTTIYSVYTVDFAMMCVVVAGAALQVMAAVSDNCVKQVRLRNLFLCIYDCACVCLLWHAGVTLRCIV